MPRTLHAMEGALLEQRRVSAAADENAVTRGVKSVGLNRVLVRITGRFYVDFLVLVGEHQNCSANQFFFSWLVGCKKS